MLEIAPNLEYFCRHQNPGLAWGSPWPNLGTIRRKNYPALFPPRVSGQMWSLPAL